MTRKKSIYMFSIDALFSPNIFHPLLVESLSEEPVDVEPVDPKEGGLFHFIDGLVVPEP